MDCSSITDVMGQWQQEGWECLVSCLFGEIYSLQLFSAAFIMLALMSVCADLFFHCKHKQLLMCVLSFSQPIWSSQVPQVLGRKGLFSSTFNHGTLGSQEWSLMRASS